MSITLLALRIRKKLFHHIFCNHPVFNKPPNVSKIAYFINMLLFNLPKIHFWLYYARLFCKKIVYIKKKKYFSKIILLGKKHFKVIYLLKLSITKRQYQYYILRKAFLSRGSCLTLKSNSVHGKSFKKNFCNVNQTCLDNDTFVSCTDVIMMEYTCH